MSEVIGVDALLTVKFPCFFEMESMKFSLKSSLVTALCLNCCLVLAAEPENPQPFGEEFPRLDSLAVGEWWKKTATSTKRRMPVR